MGDRAAEYLNFTIMIVSVLAVITIMASFMFLGRKMQNMFFDSTTKTYSDSTNGMILDLSNSEYLEMPAASVLTFMYENQEAIYDVYDGRDITDKEFVNGSLTKVTHKNINGQNTADAVTSGNTTEKFRVAVSYLNVDLNKKIKVSAKVNEENTDYYDLYLHDIDCKQDPYHTGSCKTCQNGATHTVNHGTGNCVYNYK